MEELFKQLQTNLRGMWKYRWPALLVAWLVTTVGVAVVLKIPDRYEASARLYVDTQSILMPLMSGLAIPPNVEQQVSLLSRTLITRPNVEKLIRMADLDAGAQTKAEQQKLVTELMADLKIAKAGGDNLYSLAYRNADREKAQRVIQSLVSIFMETSLGQSRRDSDAAKAFITEQIKQYEQRLEEAEYRLKQFRLRNISIQTAEGGDAASRVSSLAEQLDQARLQLREAENARDAAREQLTAERDQLPNLISPGLLQEAQLSVATPELDARIDATKRSLDALLLRYTEQHPDVVASRRLLNDLEAQKAKEIAELRRKAAASPPASSTNASSLAYQELNRMVASAEVQVASLRGRVNELTARYERAVAQLRTAPALEAEFAQLNRDYAIHKKNYEDLVARRESAAISGELELASGVGEFRLIDPPRVNPKPVAPNRLLLMPLTLVAGLASAVFLAFAASQLRPVFHEGGEVRLKTQLPLIGVVSTLMSETARRRHRVELVKFWSASGGLVLLFMAGMALMAFMAQRVA